MKRDRKQEEKIKQDYGKKSKQILEILKKTPKEKKV